MPTTFAARVDSNSANNPALNLNGDSAFVFSFVPAGTDGDIILDYNGGEFDPDTLVSIGGETYNFTFEFSAELPTLKRDGAQQVPDEFEGASIFVITVSDYPAVGDTTRLAFLPDGSATLVDMDAFGTGAVDLQNVDTTTPGVICFVAGTLIVTPAGEVAVEDLCVGDQVLTTSGDVVEIIWRSHTDLDWPGHDERSRPIVIPADTFGPRSPSRDLWVSPQHRVCLTSTISELFTGHSEVLAPAVGLLAHPLVYQECEVRSVQYHHILLERHEVLVSENLGSESFFPGVTALSLLSQEQRSGVLDAVAKSAAGLTRDYGPTALPVLSRRETETMVLHMAAGSKSRNGSN
ncbi:MAG: Hint domain-containing protein [Boseongicola sp.]|nr:Hint domain-containing protein [Boseongicola sp.]